MSLQTKVIGRTPTDHGPYNPNTSYGKKFCVTLFGCMWESLHDNNNTAPAVWDGGDTITPNLVDWKKVSGDYNAWLMNQDKPAQSVDYPFNGMGRVKLLKHVVDGHNLLYQDDFYKDGPNNTRVPNTNTVFEVPYEFELAEDITVPANCVLEFDGGSIANSSGNSYTITGQNTYILAGSTYIFKDVSLVGSFRNYYIDDMWFGTDSSNADNSSFILKAIKAAALTRIGVVKFHALNYNISNPIVISKDTIADSNVLNGIMLLGERSAFETIGTTFNFSNNAFLDIQLQHSGGHWKKIIVENILFYSDGSCNGVRLSHSQNSQFKNCSFVGLSKAVIMTYDSHLNSFENCYFRINSYAFYIPNDSTDPLFIENGAVNNNTIKQCWFEGNSEVIDLTKGSCSGWNIENSDIEGNNGVVKLSGNNTLVNVRFERNLNGVIWLDVVGNANNIIACSFYWDGIRASAVPLYVKGNHNIISAKFNGYAKQYILISRGNNNTFNVSGSSNAGTYMFDLSDKVTLNGISNQGGLQPKSLVDNIANSQNTATASYELFGSTNGMLAAGSLIQGVSANVNIGDSLFMTLVGIIQKRGDSGRRLMLSNVMFTDVVAEDDKPFLLIINNDPYTSAQAISVNAGISYSGAHPIQAILYYCNYSLNAPSFFAFDGGNSANKIDASDKDGITIHVQNISELAGFPHGLTDTTNMFFECKGKLYKNAGINQTPTIVE